MTPRNDLSLYHIIRESSLNENAPLLILFHGYGSDENDLFSFASELPEELFIISVRAPYAMQPFGNAWYAINFDAEQGKWSDTEQAKESRDLIAKFIDEAIEAYPVDANNVNLLGFSQGTILSYAVALTYPEKIKNIIALSGYVNTDNQTADVFQLNGNNLELSLSNDGVATQSVDLSSINATRTLIEDADNDTKIQVEESADEDIIRFDLGGTEFMRLDSGRIEVLNTGGSIFLGYEAGESDDFSSNKNVFDIYEPRVSKGLLAKVKRYINAQNTLHLEADVINPNYEQVFVSLEVEFYEGFDKSFYSKKLEEDITKFLSPWAFDDTKEIEFGITLHKSVLIDYLEKLEYVDYLQNVVISRTENGPDKSSISPTDPKSILVSAKQHNIQPVSSTCQGPITEPQKVCQV
mgnify:CR=1 FL=1